MEYRLYRHADKPALMAIHKRQSDHDGWKYVFADPEDPLQLATLVAEEKGRVVGCASARKTLEGYTTLDPDYGGRGRMGPLRRWTVLKKMISESSRVAYDLGYREIHVCTMAEWRGYGDRLVKQLGLVRDLRSHLYMDLQRRFDATDD